MAKRKLSTTKGKKGPPRVFPATTDHRNRFLRVVATDVPEAQGEKAEGLPTGSPSAPRCGTLLENWWARKVSNPRPAD